MHRQYRGQSGPQGHHVHVCQNRYHNTHLRLRHRFLLAYRQRESLMVPANRVFGHK